MRKTNDANHTRDICVLDAAKETLRPGILRFRIVLKPCRDQGSVAIEVVPNLYELDNHYKILLAKITKMESNGILLKDSDAPLII